MKIHIFPFKKIKKDALIVIWGLGTVGKAYIDEIAATKYCRIRYIIDSYSKMKEYKGIAVYHPDDVMYDKATIYVISIYDTNTVETVKKQLINLGVSEAQIVHSNEMYNLADVANEIIENPRNENIGLIQDKLIQKGFYLSGIPQFVDNYKRNMEYKEIKDSFCETNYIVNNLDQTRVFFLWQNIENTLKKVKGDVAEVGVYQGATAYVLEKFCDKYSRRLYLYDTFEGFSPEDAVGIDREKGLEDFKDTSVEFVKKRLGNKEAVCIKKGYFPNTVDDESRETVYAFVHIDCDLYKPIIEGLNFFWPRMVCGGMVVVHDYSSGCWEGATAAVNEFCEENHVFNILIPDWAGSVVIVKN